MTTIMMVSKSSAPMSMSFLTKDDIETLHENKSLVCFDITKALTKKTAATLGVIRTSVVSRCCSSSLTPRPRIRKCCFFFTGRLSRMIRFSTLGT